MLLALRVQIYLSESIRLSDDVLVCVNMHVCGAPRRPAVGSLRSSLFDGKTISKGLQPNVKYLEHSTHSVPVNDTLLGG